MQENIPESRPRPRSSITAEAPGILEGAHRVDQVKSRVGLGGYCYRVFTDDRHVATFYATCMEPEEVEDIKYWDFRIQELLWTRPAAIRLLRGESVADLLGFSIALRRFTRKPAWDPAPGFVGVEAIAPFENPRALPAMEVLRLVVSQ